MISRYGRVMNITRMQRSTRVRLLIAITAIIRVLAIFYNGIGVMDTGVPHAISIFPLTLIVGFVGVESACRFLPHNRITGALLVFLDSTVVE